MRLVSPTRTENHTHSNKDSLDTWNHLTWHEKMKNGCWPTKIWGWQKKSPRRKIQDLLTDLCYPKSNWSFLHPKRKFTSAWVARQKCAGFEQKQSWKRRYATKMGACEVWAVSTSRLPKLKPKEQRRQRRKIRFRLTRWNVLDSTLNHLEQFQTEKLKRFRGESIWNVLSFLLEPWNDKIGVSSNSDSLSSHFHWIWNVSTNMINDFTKWFWFNWESFLERN
jgi:hypothetical protein